MSTENTPATANEVEEIDIEATAAEGRRPRAKRYRIRVDRERHVVENSHPLGREILEVAGKQPPENWMLSQRLHGGKVVPISLDQTVDLTAPGVERFMTLPKDQTEG